MFGETPEGPYDRDVVVVGGGPTGASAAVFTAREGLDTLVFDRGNAALARAAYVENYPGFPGGIGVDLFIDLLHDHVETAGADLIADMVTAVERLADEADPDPDGPGGLRVTPQDGDPVTTRYVLAAAWYDGTYLAPLDDDGELRHEEEHHGEVAERFDPDYPDEDGRTPVSGLYVGAPADQRNAQAVVAAGQGAHVARALLEDYRHEVGGLPEGVAKRYDWLRRESEFSGEWADRERWETWFDREAGDDHGLADEAYERLREAYIDRQFASARSEAEREALGREGQRRLLAHLDDDLIREAAATISDADADGND